MNYFWYNLCLCLLMPFLMLYFAVKKPAHGKSFFRWRFGFYNRDFLAVQKFPARIWLHAASVGEINAIVSFVGLLRANYPDAWIGVSTMTITGLDTAREKIPQVNQHFIVPFDLFFAARRAMRQIRPTLFLTVETEIWPNLLKYAKRYEAVAAMINGRVSVRKAGQYIKHKSFLRKVLGYYDACSMILPVDAERITAMGADPSKISINGNVKFDSLSYNITAENRSQMLSLFHLTGTEKVLVAGSTREGEEEQILQAIRKVKAVFPDLVLIIAPRHIQRGPEIAALTAQYGFQPLLRTDIISTTTITPETVIILNTIGELFKVYSLATLAFCGASLVPLGGQNPLEPASWGKVVLYGPSMEDFLDAKKLLEEAGAGMEVGDHETLAQRIISLLHDEKKLGQLGTAGQKAVLAQQGSSLRNLQLLNGLINKLN